MSKQVKEAKLNRQIAGKILAQSNKERDPSIQKKMRQITGKLLADANKVIKDIKDIKGKQVKKT
jgi:hypothetical protein